MHLNNSKLFAGIIMILLNVGSKFIQIQFSKSTEEYLKSTVSKQVLVFAMAWLGTRDIYTALILTLLFTLGSEYLFNEDSTWCIVPASYRVLTTLVDTTQPGAVTEQEIQQAHQVLQRAKEQQRQQMQRHLFSLF